MNPLKFIFTLAVGLTLSTGSLAQTTKQTQEGTHPPISNLQYKHWQITRIYQKGIEPLSQSEWLEIRTETIYYTVPPSSNQPLKRVHLYKCYLGQDCEKLVHPIGIKPLKKFLIKTNLTSIGVPILVLALFTIPLITNPSIAGGAAVGGGAAAFAQGVGIGAYSMAMGIFLVDVGLNLKAELPLQQAFEKTFDFTVKFFRDSAKWIISSYKNGPRLRKLLSKKHTLFVKDLKKLEDELKNIIDEAL